jgi:hypothetical protein
MDQEQENRSRHIRVDEDLYRQAQLVAVIEGRTLKELTEEAIRALLSTKQVSFTLHPSLSPQVAK